MSRLVATRVLSGAVFHDLPDSVAVGIRGQTGVEFHELELKVAGQHHLAVGCPPERALGAEGLLVVGKNRLPAEHIPQIVGHGLLNQDTFGEV